MSKVVARHKLLTVSMVVAVLSFGVAAFADEGYVYRGCKVDVRCPFNDGEPNSGMCSFDGSQGENGACVCNELMGEQGMKNTCDCSTGQYPPCGSGGEN